MRTLHLAGYRLAVASIVWLAGVLQLVAAAVQEADAGAGARPHLPALVPRPARIEPQPGTWVLDSKTRLVAKGPAAAEADRLADALSPPLGRRLAVVDGPSRAGDVVFSLEDSRVDLGGEGYELRVTPKGVRLIARRAAGLFYASQTLRQLLPDAAWRKAPVDPSPWIAPCVRIVDHPRFGWRGLLLDPARHFIATAELREFIDAMAMHKLNRLQLHLTDDQGWRIEIRAFPRLTARSSWRDGTLLDHLNEGPERISTVPHGGFYSQEDLREIVAYAAARHIVVVPEIEMPGHTGAWLAAYPEFAVFPDQAAGLPVRTRWGINRDVLAPRRQTLEACRRVLDEVCEIFPSPWIHIGGDEAPRDQWRESAEMQNLIRTLGLRGEDELQAWFTAQLSHYLAAKGRRLVGWDEILDGAALGGQAGKTGLATNAIAMSWRSWLGEKGERAAARGGHDTIMAPADGTYLDHYQGPPKEEPLAIGESLSLAHVYAYDPAPGGLPEAVARHVLGAQAQVWGEYLATFEAIGYMTFPRACAMAEVCWSQPAAKNLAGFLQRLERHEARLHALGIPHRPLARRTCLPDASGQIAASSQDAMIHGTEIVREPDGSLSGWKDSETLIAWRLELPGAGTYRVRVLLKPSAANPAGWLEAMIADRVLRADVGASTNRLELGEFRVDRAGPRLLFLRAGGPAGPEGFAIVRGVELSPGK
jgi:hexosaminidase